MTAAGSGGRWLPALCLFGTLLFSTLGAWQVQRLGWKRELIARVEARIAADPVAAPPAQTWASLDVAEAQYRKVQARGEFLHALVTRVDALTALGAGHWVITPLRTADGIVLVNRGFVPREAPGDASGLPADGQVPPPQAGSGRAAQPDPPGEVLVVGLLRNSEPDGRILRPNQPANDRWFSRDVAAIAAARGLDNVAPYFIDADSASSEPGGPLGGLTVVHFRNAHLTYAITWFALAALCVGGLAISTRSRQPSARPGAGEG